MTSLFTYMLPIGVTMMLAHAYASESRSQGPELKEKMPWYHTGDEIHSEIQDLSRNCPGVDIQLTQRSQLNLNGQGEVSLDVLKVRKKGGAPQTKAFFVFGEHARELITGESALNFVQTLCGRTSHSERAADVLDDVEFTIVPNANPTSRKLVEAGQYCKRTNEDGVDINRNWSDEHRDASQNVADNEDNPGPNAFSEPETQILKSLIDEAKADIYLTVHSGAYLLGTPFGYTTSTANLQNQAQMEDVLKIISQKYCDSECPYGNTAELIGYKSGGCDIDYVSEKLGVPYAYTWEIYASPDHRAHYVAEAKESGFLQKSSNLSWQSAKMRNLPESMEVASLCLSEFNPVTQEETQAVAQKWSGAYLLLCEQVAHRQKQRPSTTVATQAAATSTTSASVLPESTVAAMTPHDASFWSAPDEVMSTTLSELQPLSPTTQSSEDVSSLAPSMSFRLRSTFAGDTPDAVNTVSTYYAALSRGLSGVQDSTTMEPKAELSVKRFSADSDPGSHDGSFLAQARRLENMRIRST